jgi:hypothetical protein
MKLPQIKISQAADIARIAFASNRFFAIYGKGGVGKTSIATNTIAPALGFDEVWKVNLSGSLPQDAVGYLVPVLESREGFFIEPEQWPTAKRVGDKRVLLVLDEFPEWDSSIQSLCRSLFDTDGGPPKIGVHELGRNVKIMITGNRRSDGARSAVPTAPLVSRCASFAIEPSLDDWLDWAAGEGLAASPIFTFLKFQGGDQHGVDHFSPDIPQPWDGSPHPTPRQWEAACRAMLDDQLDDRLAALVLEGFVGEAAGRAAYAFIKLVGDLMPKLNAIRSGAEDMPADPASQQALTHAALRIAKRETAADPAVAVASGALDWLVERILLPARGEIRAYGYATALRCGLPLDQHPRRQQMQGV